MSIRSLAVAIAVPTALVGATVALPASAQQSCGYYSCSSYPAPAPAPSAASREVLAERAVVLERFYARSRDANGAYGAYDTRDSRESRKRSSRRDRDEPVVERIIERPVYIDRPVYVDRATGYPVQGPGPAPSQPAYGSSYGGGSSYSSGYAGQPAYAPPPPRPLTGAALGGQSQTYRQGGGQVQSYEYGSAGVYGSAESQRQSSSSTQQGGWSANAQQDTRYGSGGGWLPRTMDTVFGASPTQEQTYARPAY
jgi:hypothetical protein